MGTSTPAPVNSTPPPPFVVKDGVVVARPNPNPNVEVQPVRIG